MLLQAMSAICICCALREVCLTYDVCTSDSHDAASPYLMQDVALSPTHKLGITPSIFQDTEKGDDKIGVGNADVNVDPSQVEAERVRVAGRHRRRNEVPWASLVMFFICAAFLGVGMWLLFGTNGIQGGPM